MIQPEGTKRELATRRKMMKSVEIIENSDNEGGLGDDKVRFFFNFDSSCCDMSLCSCQMCLMLLERKPALLRN
jgi:hypothetical protein